MINFFHPNAIRVLTTTILPPGYVGNNDSAVKLWLTEKNKKQNEAKMVNGANESNESPRGWPGGAMSSHPFWPPKKISGALAGSPRILF